MCVCVCVCKMEREIISCVFRRVEVILRSDFEVHVLLSLSHVPLGQTEDY